MALGRRYAWFNCADWLTHRRTLPPEGVCWIDAYRHHALAAHELPCNVDFIAQGY